MRKEETHNLAAGTFIVRADGIVVGIPTAKDMDLDDAKEFLALWRRIQPNGKIRLLLDERGVSRKMSPESRAYFSENIQDVVEMIAILVKNTFSRFFASGVLAVMHTGKTKARAFDNEQAALEWLRSGASSKAASG